MAKQQLDLQAVKKHHFWILVAVALLALPTSWMIMRINLDERFTKDRSTRDAVRPPKQRLACYRIDIQAAPWQPRQDAGQKISVQYGSKSRARSFILPSTCKKTALERLTWLDKELGNNEFIAGERFSIADITGMIGIDFGRITGIKILDDQKNLKRWHEAVSSRPSAKA